MMPESLTRTFDTVTRNKARRQQKQEKNVIVFLVYPTVKQTHSKLSTTKNSNS
jgi:hypothetical protein